MSDNSFGVVDKEYTGRRVTQQGPIAANQPIKLPIYISDKQQVMVHINNGTGSRLLAVNEYEYSAGATSNLYLPTINVSASETVHVMFLGAVPYDQAFFLTAFAQTLLDDADATTALATLGAVSRAGLQNQSYISATTAGTAPTYTASITPVPTLATGLRVRAKFHAATTAASTLNLNGLGAKSIKQYDNEGAKIPAVIAANMLTDVEYDGTDWVVLNPVPYRSGGAGEVCYFAGAIVPTGWLKCNGALLSRTTYAALFAAISTTYGAGDGSTTFALPDLRGEFVRGFDDGRGVDSGRAFGSNQGDAIRNLSGEVRFETVDGSEQLIWSSSGVFSHSAETAQGGHKQIAIGASGSWEQTLSFSADKVVPTAAENRPRNVAMHYIIKF